MSKNLLQDMVKVKTLNRKIIRKETEEKTENVKKSGGSKYGLYFVALIAVVFLFFAVSFIFSGAEIIVNPKVKSIPLNDDLSAIKDESSGGLSFHLIAISGEESKTIQGKAEKDLLLKSKGTVIVYNNFSSANQSLNVNTQLLGSNGKIYKTDKKIIIPGIKNGRPGSIEVGIYGELPGEEYNSAPLDFKILGFKGTSKYSKIYARSKGDITGGLKGKSYSVSSLDKISTTSELKSILEKKLFKKAIDQVPAGFILFKDAVFLDIDKEDTSIVLSKDSMIPVSVKGTFYGFLFEEKKLTEKIALDVIEKYNGDEIYIPNIKDLIFTLSNKNDISFENVKNINFNLSGNPTFIWKVNTKELINDVLGKDKKDFNQILSTYVNIDSADLSLTPPWKISFPEKVEDIEVIVNYPN